jgi:hypothetical protein
MADKQRFYIPNTQDFHKYDKQCIKLTYIIHYYIDQESPASLLDLLYEYSKYSDSLLDVVQFVVIDDGSPLEFNPPEYDLNIIWLRITDNIPWNQGGARNLGMTYAKSDKVLITDLDHKFPEHTLKRMTNMGNLGKKFYKIWKKDLDSQTYGRPHPNTFLISRGRFFRLYGYDEEFSGGYGAEDYRFVKFQKNHGSWQKKLPRKYYCIKRDVDRELSYHSLVRDHSRNTPIDQRKRNELLYWGEESGHSRIFLNFNWKLVFQHNRISKPDRQSKRLWKHLWLIRTFMSMFCK